MTRYATLESLLAHYTWVAVSFDKAHAWARAQQLAKDSPMYSELPRLLTLAMLEQKALLAAKDAATTAPEAK